MSTKTKKSGKKKPKNDGVRSKTPGKAKKTENLPEINTFVQRPVVQPIDDGNSERFGQSLYVDNEEDTAEAIASQQPSFAQDKLYNMKTFIISRNPHTKPISYKQSKNTAQLRFLGPKPPEFIMRSKPPNINSDTFEPEAPQRRNTNQTLPPLEHPNNLPPQKNKIEPPNQKFQETFTSGGSMFTEQQDDTYQGEVQAIFRTTYDELNFVKENINHRVPTDLKTTNYHGGEQIPQPQIVNQTIPKPTPQTQVNPNKNQIPVQPPVEKLPIKSPQKVDVSQGQEVTQQIVSPNKQNNLAFQDDPIPRQQLDQIFATEESELSEGPIQNYEEFQNYQEYPSKPPVNKPMEGFQVPLIAEQDPKKLFNFQQLSPIVKTVEDIPRNFNYQPLPKAFVNLNEDYEDVYQQEPNYLPAFNWEPVQMNKKNNNYIPHELKVNPDFNKQPERLPFRNREEPDYIEKYEKEETKSGYKKFIISFVKEGRDGKGRRAYNFYLKPLSTVFDLKEVIADYFGYDVSQQRLFKEYIEINNDVVLDHLPLIDEEVMILGQVGHPYGIGEGLPQKAREKAMSNVRGINCSSLSHEEFYNVASEENIVMPPYRDWNYEWQKVFKKAREIKSLVNLEQKIYQTREMANFIEIEKTLVNLSDNFKTAALKAVQLIEKQHIKPIYLGSMFGKGGLKYITGGMVIRECKNWTLLTKDLGEGSLCYKIASNEHRAFDFLRGKVQEIEVPLSCLINYYGTGYFVQSICPITPNSLVYGSNTEGIDISSKEFVLEAVQNIKKLFNIKEHVVYDRVNRVGKYLSLPYDCEIHGGEDRQLYLLNPVRLLAPEIADQENLYEINGRVFRPEFQSHYCIDELEEDYALSTWRRPVKCEACDQFITDYEFYYYEKRSLNRDRNLLFQFYYCLDCYARLKPLDGFKVPIDKLGRKTVPIQERKTFWINLKNGEVCTIKPGKKINLNPDATIMFPEFSKGEEKNYVEKENTVDQRTLIEASNILRESICRQFITELDNFEIIVKRVADFSHLLHERGINVRFLGMIALETKHNFIKEQVTREILARSIKVLLRDGLYFLQKQFTKDYEADAKKFIIYYLNEVFAVDDRETSVYNKFNIKLDKTIMSSIYLPGLVYRIFQAFNIKTNKFKGFDFQSNEVFALKDIIKIQPNVKVKTQYSLCIEQLLKHAREKDSIGKRSKWFLEGGPERIEATNLFREAAAISEYIYGNQSKEAAQIFKEFALHLEERHAEIGKPEYSKWNKCMNIPENELSVESRNYYQKALKSFILHYGEWDPLVAECYISMAYLHKVPFDAYSDQEVSKTYWKHIFNYFLKAIEIFDMSVGVDHPDTADICVKLALAYQEANLLKEAYPWIQRAFCTFIDIFGPDDEVTIQIYDHVKSIGIYFDPDIGRVHIESMREYIEKIVF